MKIIKGFEGEDLKVSDFGEWVGKDYIDYKSEYENNQKIIKLLIRENKELKEQLKELESIVGLRQKRNLISKFDKEYDEEDKKKNPNRDYARIMPDAEEIYKRYYAMKNQQKEFIEWLENEINICDGFLDAIKSDLEEISYAGRVSGKTYIATQIMKNETSKKNYEEILSKYKEIIGEKNERNKI